MKRFIRFLSQIIRDVCDNDVWILCLLVVCYVVGLIYVHYVPLRNILPGWMGIVDAFVATLFIGVVLFSVIVFIGVCLVQIIKWGIKLVQIIGYAWRKSK